MLPLLPPAPLAELAREHLGYDAPKQDTTPMYDADNYFTESNALQPDPVFMGLRALVEHSPLGTLMQWIDRKRDEREDRIYGARIDDVVSQHNTVAYVTALDHDDSDQQIAA